MTAILITTAAAVTVHAANFIAADAGQRLHRKVNSRTLED